MTFRTVLNGIADVTILGSFFIGISIVSNNYMHGPIMTVTSDVTVEEVAQVR